jgi:hypothetical protein
MNEEEIKEEGEEVTVTTPTDGEEVEEETEEEGEAAGEIVE